MKNPEQKLYLRVVKLREEADSIIEDAIALDPTIELCLFTGKLSAAVDVLTMLEAAGVPMHDADEESHPLEKN